MISYKKPGPKLDYQCPTCNADLDVLMYSSGNNIILIDFKCSMKINYSPNKAWVYGYCRYANKLFEGFIEPFSLSLPKFEELKNELRRIQEVNK